jgi:hypothetical protein
VSELPHLVGEFTHLVKADGGIMEFCKKRGIQYGKYMRDNPGE